MNLIFSNSTAANYTHDYIYIVQVLMRIMACSEKSKNFKKWQQTNMKNYFIVKNSGTKKIYCEDCRRKFQSVYHLNHHLSSVMPCRDAYGEPRIDEPNTLKLCLRETHHNPRSIPRILHFLFIDMFCI